jgi:hypothetical protein
MFRVTPQFLLTVALEHSDFNVLYHGATRQAIHYDFDSDCFWVKFSHPDLDEVEDGARTPFIDPPNFVQAKKPWWRFWR